MSLISNTDYLIHSMRLSYLRNVEDPYGPRLITLDPSYNSNPYILAASLADTERWPEISAPHSPQPSDDDGDRPLGFPGSTSLKHTQTIMGKRSGGLGLRVHGKRESTSSRRLSRLSVAKSDSDSIKEPAPALAPPSEVTVKVQEPSAPTEAQAPVQFVPKFKGAAEMEARRKMRMMNRRGPGAAPPQPAQPLNLELSSSSEDEPEPAMTESEDDDEFGFPHGSDDGDEFDPIFAASRSPTHLGSSLDIQISPSQTRHASRARLSPVNERHHSIENNLSITRPPIASSFKVASSAPEPKSIISPPITTASDVSFSRRPVGPIKPIKSALSAMLATSGSSTNPFSELYAAISGRGQSAAMKVRVYFPCATRPAGKPMELSVRKDASMEEVIGFALWSYWEDGWLPKLDEGVENEDDPKLSAIGWIMRIAEDDGEVDDEFPPPDRTGKVSKFNFDAYAVLEANPSQIQQNKVLETKIQRRPSRVTAKKKAEPKPAPPANLTLTAPNPAPTPSSVTLGAGSLPLPTLLGPSPSQGPQIFLRIRVADTVHAVHVSTTIPVSAEMYMQEVLEMVCRKRKLDSPKDYALLVRDVNILIPLDRTVASLQGKRELLLIKRSMLNEYPGVIQPAYGRTTDPNASIFKRLSDVPQTYSSNDFTAAYKKYTVYRKQSMMISRQERTLAIDGVFIHIMPATNNGGKTYSYHIKSIAACEQSMKYTSMFKLVLHRMAGSKRRFDFEAETPKLAAEIVQTISELKNALERNGTVGRSRKSRQVV